MGNTYIQLYNVLYIAVQYIHWLLLLHHLKHYWPNGQASPRKGDKYNMKSQPSMHIEN